MAMQRGSAVKRHISGSPNSAIAHIRRSLIFRPICDSGRIPCSLSKTAAVILVYQVAHTLFWFFFMALADLKQIQSWIGPFGFKTGLFSAFSICAYLAVAFFLHWRLKPEMSFRESFHVAVLSQVYTPLLTALFAFNRIDRNVISLICIPFLFAANRITYVNIDAKDEQGSFITLIIVVVLNMVLYLALAEFFNAFPK